MAASTEQAADACSRLLNHVERLVDLRPAVDPSYLASVLGITVGRSSALREEGRTEWNADGSVSIHLRNGRPLVRERFTLAHEIGHVLLSRRPGLDIVRELSGSALDRQTEEFWCNEFAGRLLVPDIWLQDFESIGPTLDWLVFISDHCKVSLSVAYIRSKVLYSPGYALIRFVRRTNGWVVASQCGIDVRLTPLLSFGEETSSALDRLESNVANYPLPFRLSGHRRRTLADIRRYRDSCVVLAQGIGS